MTSDTPQGAAIHPQNGVWGRNGPHRPQNHAASLTARAFFSLWKGTDTAGSSGAPATPRWLRRRRSPGQARGRFAARTALAASLLSARWLCGTKTKPKSSLCAPWSCHRVMGPVTCAAPRPGRLVPSSPAERRRRGAAGWKRAERKGNGFPSRSRTSCPAQPFCAPASPHGSRLGVSHERGDT